jgi:site-specific DNA-methyltransferase (adenine-specific)/modification methylase
MSAILKKEVIGGQTLILGDCLEVMPELGRFDAVVTDPPYGIGVAKKGRHGGAGSKLMEKSKGYSPKKYAPVDWDERPPSGRTLQFLQNISDNQIFFGGNHFALSPSRGWLVWDKQATGEFSDCELAWTSLDQPIKRIVWLWNGLCRKNLEPRFNHPTQKPVGVMEWCIGHLPNDAKTILDPFMGSGTTLVACQRLGRSGTGIELDKDYYEIACERVHEAWRSPDLFIEEPKALPPQQLGLLDGDAA